MLDGVGTWQEIDRALRELARDQCALDAREAPLLRHVVRDDVWRHASKVSLYAYLEEVLGYGPKVARERVRVALALEQLPELARALADGEHSYTAIRELTRIVTPATETEWLDKVRDCNSARVQELVSMHEHGDLPTDPEDLRPKKCVITIELTPMVYAQWRQAQTELATELGQFVDDNTTIEMLCAARNAAPDSTGKTKPRAQIQTTICETCSQGFVNAGGRRVPISDGERDMAECDAVRIGSDRKPKRAKRDISPATRRHVRHRDHNRCVVSGCRSTRHVDIHHIIPRSQGGSHEPDNLVLLCSGHHRFHHDGKLSTEVLLAKAAQPRAGREPAPKQHSTIVMTDATQALIGLGFSKREVHDLVERSLETKPSTTEELVFAALRLAGSKAEVIRYRPS